MPSLSPSRRGIILSLVTVFGVAASIWFAYPKKSTQPSEKMVKSAFNSTSDQDSRTTIAQKSEVQPVPVKESQKAIDLVKQLGGTAIVAQNGQVVSINLLGCSLKDEDLIHLSTTPEIKLLNLDNTTIGDDGLKFIHDLPQLKILKLSRTKITDAGLRSLRNLPAIQMLYLNETNITDEGLMNLADLPSVRNIEAMGSPLTGLATQIVRERFPECKLKH